MASPLKSCGCGCLLGLLTFAGHPAEGAGITEQLQLAQKANDLNAEIELLRRHLATTPSDAAARERLVRLWLKEGDFAMAQATLDEWKDAPKLLVVLVKAKTLAADQVGVTEAITVLQEFGKQAPGNPETLELLSQYLARQQRWAERLAVLDERVKLKPSASVYLERAQPLRELGQYAAAIQAARQAMMLVSEQDSLRGAGVPYERLASALPIIEFNSALLGVDPDNASARLRRGMALHFGDAASQALADANAAAKRVPDLVAVRLLQVLNTPSEEWPDESGVNRSAPPITPQAAESLIQSDLRLANNPADGAARLARARWLRAAGQPRLALRDVEELLAKEPTNGAALMETIRANVAIQQPDEAAAYFRRLERAKVSDTEMADALALIAQTYFKNYNFSQALEFADQSLALRETDAMLNVKLQSLQRLGRGEEARAVEARIQRRKSEKKS